MSTHVPHAARTVGRSRNGEIIKSQGQDSMNSAINELLQQAFAHHQAGANHEAEALYRHVLTREPGRDIDAVTMLQLAVAALNRRGNSNAQHAALYNNFGNALRAAGRGR